MCRIFQVYSNTVYCLAQDAVSIWPSDLVATFGGRLSHALWSGLLASPRLLKGRLGSEGAESLLILAFTCSKNIFFWTLPISHCNAMQSSVTITQNEKLFDEWELKSRLCRPDGLKRRLGKYAEDVVFLAFFLSRTDICSHFPHCPWQNQYLSKIYIDKPGVAGAVFKQVDDRFLDPLSSKY